MLGMPVMYRNHHKGAYKRTDFSNALPFKIDGEYCLLVQLTKGIYSIVEVSDFDLVAQYQWHALWSAPTNSYYAVTSVTRSDGKRRHLRMHRLILGLGFGEGNLGDHKNGVTVDNRRNNLRVVNYSQNAINCKTRRDSKFGKGIVLHGNTGHFESRISANGKSIYLGVSDSLDKAREVRRMAEEDLHGVFRRME